VVVSDEIGVFLGLGRLDTAEAKERNCGKQQKGKTTKGFQDQLRKRIYDCNSPIFKGPLQ